MTQNEDQPPESLTDAFRTSLLKHARGDDCLGVFELSLFEFYMNENAATIDRMLSAERAYVEEQERCGIEMVNDSGIVAAEYFTKRIRYADVIYLWSLIETFLESACKKLELVLNRPDIRFEAKCRPIRSYRRTGIRLQRLQATSNQHQFRPGSPDRLSAAAVQVNTLASAVEVLSSPGAIRRLCSCPGHAYLLNIPTTTPKISSSPRGRMTG